MQLQARHMCPDGWRDGIPLTLNLTLTPSHPLSPPLTPHPSHSLHSPSSTHRRPVPSRPARAGAASNSKQAVSCAFPLDTEYVRITLHLCHPYVEDPLYQEFTISEWGAVTECEFVAVRWAGGWAGWWVGGVFISHSASCGRSRMESL